MLTELPHELCALVAQHLEGKDALRFAATHRAAREFRRGIHLKWKRTLRAAPRDAEMLARLADLGVRAPAAQKIILPCKPRVIVFVNHEMYAEASFYMRTGVRDAQIECLCSAMRISSCAALQRFDAAFQKVGASGARALASIASTHLTKLRELNLGTLLGDEGAEHVATIVQHTPLLGRLNLWKNTVSTPAPLIKQLPRLKHLYELVLAHNPGVATPELIVSLKETHLSLIHISEPTRRS